MSTDMTTVAERARSVLENDVLKIIVALAGMYALFILFGFILGYDANGYAVMLQRLTLLCAVYGITVLALNLQWGYAGLFNIGVVGFMAVGAYTMAMVTAPPTGRVPGLGLPLIVGIVAGMVAAALVGFIAALPALRLRADYLAIVTIALSEIIRYTYLLPPLQEFTIFGVQLGTGGGSGIGISTHPSDVLPPLILENPLGQAALSFFVGMGIEEAVIDSWIYVLFLIAVGAAFYWLVMRIGFSPFGRVLKAIREDEDVANALGKNTTRFKIKVFMVGCGLMGLAGILWQANRGFINPNSFRPLVTFFIWIALIIGGSGSNTGTVLGGILFAGLLFQAPRYISNVLSSVLDVGGSPAPFADAVGPLFALNFEPFIAYTIGNFGPLRIVFTGVILILLMQHRPDGLLGHRKETAASIDITRRNQSPATDGGSASSPNPEETNE